MTEADSDRMIEAIAAYFEGKGWGERSCDQCGKRFLIKSRSTVSSDRCERGKCAPGRLTFKRLAKQRKFATPNEIEAKVERLFSVSGVAKVPSLSIVSTAGETNLVVAGVQILDDVIHEDQPLRTEPVFVAQPCMRMKFLPSVGSAEGVSTSFVNVCTEHMTADFEAHVRLIDRWCDALSEVGLHMNDFRIVLRTSEKDWGTGSFRAVEAFFMYGGLELGDAAYFHIPRSNGDPVSISDIGFGLERIVWAINKTPSYFDLLMPATFIGEPELFDAVRSVTLLAICGVLPGNKGPGLQFRRFARTIGERFFGEDAFQLLPHCIDYWSRFVQPSVDSASAVRVVRREAERFVNLKICERLSLPAPRDESTEEYFARLVYTHGAEVHQLRDALKQCKK